LSTKSINISWLNIFRFYFQQFLSFPFYYLTLNCPGICTSITPAHKHISLQFFVTPGWLATVTIILPGIQGDGVLGIHGIGVSAPIAAAVAEATTGLASDWHKPNGRIFTMGLLSIILACGMLLFITRFTGNTINEDGASPMLHFKIAPLHTNSAIIN